jgi:hypothetical protein
VVYRFRAGHVQGITVRVFVALVRLIVAAQVQDFIKMTNLTSAACVPWKNPWKTHGKTMVVR